MFLIPNRKLCGWHYPSLSLRCIAPPGPLQKGVANSIHLQKHEPIQTNSSFEMLMAVTRDRVVAGLLTQNHQSQPLWRRIMNQDIKMANPHISWLTWTWRKFKPQATCGHQRQTSTTCFLKNGRNFGWMKSKYKMPIQRGKFMLSSEATNLKWSHTHILFDLDRDSW